MTKNILVIIGIVTVLTIGIFIIDTIVASMAESIKIIKLKYKQKHRGTDDELYNISRRSRIYF